MYPRVQGSDQQQDEQRKQPGSDGAQSVESPSTTRITVNIGPDTERALRTLMATDRVTLTEAVRRLVGYGELMYRAIKIDGKDILIRQDGETQQVILV